MLWNSDRQSRTVFFLIDTVKAQYDCFKNACIVTGLNPNY